MEFIVFISIIFIIGIIGAIVSWIGDLIDKWKSKVRDDVAEEVLKNRDIKKEISVYKKRLKYVDYKRHHIVNQGREFFIDPPFMKTRLLDRCPQCDRGYLTVRNGKYGKFVGCSEYPRCSFTQNLKKVKYEYSKNANESIVDNLKRIYS